jgi:hypothetical protein
VSALNRCRAPRRRAGVSLVELLIATAILTVLLGGIGMLVLRGQGVFQQSLTNNDLEVQARRIVDRILLELMDADRSSLVLTPPAPFGASTIDYARGEGVVGGVLAVGATRRIRWRMLDTEVDDGVDNNNNGLIDEGRIELLPDSVGAPGEVIGLGSYVREYLEGETPDGADNNANGVVDERGLCMTYNAATQTVTVRVTLERFDPLGGLVTRTVENSAQIRND